MAIYGCNLATARFELIIADISRTACDSSMKFGTYIHLNEGYLYWKQKKLSILCNKGSKVKKLFFFIYGL